MVCFCTYFDRNYLPRVLALYRSLERHCANFRLFAMCMDLEAHEAFEALLLPHAVAIRLEEVESANPELVRVRSSRSTVEYYYTCGPSFIWHLLTTQKDIDFITYLDADLFFFSDPKPVLNEVQGCSVGIIEHRRTEELERKLTKFGVYNVGWVSFRRDEHGLACLMWWAQRCIEWCYDRVEGNRFADQKYLDEFPARFQSVRVIRHKGANLAPWNVANFTITEQDGRIFVDDQPLVFFHYHGLKMLRPWLFDTNLGWYGARPSALVRQKIFGPYISELNHLTSYDSFRTTIRYRDRGFAVLSRIARLGAQVGFALRSRSYVVVYRGSVL